MLEDPRVNFAISTRVSTRGVDHRGIQVEAESELQDLRARPQPAARTLDIPVKTSGCCG